MICRGSHPQLSRSHPFPPLERVNRDPVVDRRLAQLLPVDRWPTAQEAAESRWFSPLREGNLSLSHRTWIPAMVPWRATEEGFVTPAVLDWYGRFARGRPGALVVEATGVREIKSGPLLRAGDDRFIPGLKQLVQRVKSESGGHTRLFIQLIDFLSIKRRPVRETFLERHLAITPALRQKLGPQWSGRDERSIREHLKGLDEGGLAEVLPERELESYRYGLRERVTDTHMPHIAELPRVLPALFAQASRRCLEAGFDGIELHCAHAYTLASFLSPSNQRDDGYGGSREARVRLPLEVYEATRQQLGSSAVIGARFLTDEIFEGGGRVDDASYYAVQFARAGMDFLSLSRGGKFEDAKQPKVGRAAYPYTGPSGHECMPTPRIGPPGPFGRNVADVGRVRAAVRAEGFSIPVVACGGISSYWQAEEVLAREEADIVASARQSLADPDWFEKIRLGRGTEVRRCFFTNYCEGLDQSHESVTCQRWDRLKGLGDDDSVARAGDGRRLTAPGWGS